MKRDSGIGKRLIAMLGVAAVSGLLLSAAGGAFAQPAQTSSVDKATRAFCQWSSQGNEKELEACLKEDARSKARLKALHATPEEEAYCKVAARGDTKAYERCIKQVTSPESRAKVKELKKKAERKKGIKESREGGSEARRPSR